MPARSVATYVMRRHDPEYYKTRSHGDKYRINTERPTLCGILCSQCDPILSTVFTQKRGTYGSERPRHESVTRAACLTHGSAKGGRSGTRERDFGRPTERDGTSGTRKHDRARGETASASDPSDWDRATRCRAMIGRDAKRREAGRRPARRPR